MTLRDLFTHSPDQDCTNPFALRHFIKFLPQGVGHALILTVFLFWPPEPVSFTPSKTDWTITADDSLRNAYDGKTKQITYYDYPPIDDMYFARNGKALARHITRYQELRPTFWELLIWPPTWVGDRELVLLPGSPAGQDASFNLPSPAWTIGAISPDGEWFMTFLVPGTWGSSSDDDVSSSSEPTLLRNDGSIVKAWGLDACAGQFSGDGRRLLLFAGRGIRIVNLATFDEKWIPTPPGTSLVRTSTNYGRGKHPQRLVSVELARKGETERTVALVDVDNPSPTFEPFVTTPPMTDMLLMGNTLVLKHDYNSSSFFDIKARTFRGSHEATRETFSIECLVSEDEVGTVDRSEIQSTRMIDEVITKPTREANHAWRILSNE